MLDMLILTKWRLQGMIHNLEKKIFCKKSAGIDGILVTVGLCIIALVLCVVMKDALSTFITELVSDMQEKASGILGGNT